LTYVQEGTNITAIYDGHLKGDLFAKHTNTLTESTFTINIIFITEPHIKADCGNNSFSCQTCLTCAEQIINNCLKFLH